MRQCVRVKTEADKEEEEWATENLDDCMEIDEFDVERASAGMNITLYLFIYSFKLVFLLLLPLCGKIIPIHKAM